MPTKENALDIAICAFGYFAGMKLYNMYADHREARSIAREVKANLKPA